MFCWFSSQLDLPGNEIAEVSLRAAALHGNLVSVTTLGSEVCPFFIALYYLHSKTSGLS